MKTAYLTKLILRTLLTANIIITVLVWFYFIAENSLNQHDLLNVFAPTDTNKIVATILCIAYLLISIVMYEFVIVQFDQADTLKEILKELKLSRELKKMDDMESAKEDARIDFSKVR
ncbi:hypothetical protein [Rouxiella sp. WC2420]|uniref:DUF1049 domain-containing protein n=1 Tax=Rouxiella sp. WC2420 TaxID=3234145 RepID=A0AB39VZ13_9GAMM